MSSLENTNLLENDEKKNVLNNHNDLINLLLSTPERRRNPFLIAQQIDSINPVTFFESEYKQAMLEDQIMASRTTTEQNVVVNNNIDEKEIERLCEILQNTNSSIVLLKSTLDRIDEILQIGQHPQLFHESATLSENPYALLIEKHKGLDALEELQRHNNREVYGKVVNIIQQYFYPEYDEM